MTKKALAVFIVAVAILLQPCVSAAQSDYEFYFFGVNLKTFKDSNWLMVATGAVTSMLTHELGHALYLESQGKDWNLLPSSSGLAITTDNYLTDKQYRNFGRSGFALQTGIGTILASFKSTKHSDFTKGFVSMNAVQFYTYDHGGHDNGSDFALIERGNVTLVGSGTFAKSPQKSSKRTQSSTGETIKIKAGKKLKDAI